MRCLPIADCEKRGSNALHVKPMVLFLEFRQLRLMTEYAG